MQFESPIGQEEPVEPRLLYCKECHQNITSDDVIKNKPFSYYNYSLEWTHNKCGKVVDQRYHYADPKGGIYSTPYCEPKDDEFPAIMFGAPEFTTCKDCIDKLIANGIVPVPDWRPTQTIPEDYYGK